MSVPCVFFAPIDRQFVESVSSKYDLCAQKHVSSEMDIVRVGHFSSSDSRRIERSNTSNQQIRDAGDNAMAVARELGGRAVHAVPNEMLPSKKEHDWKKYLHVQNDRSKYGSNWVVRRVMDDELSSEESESDVREEEGLSGTSGEESGDVAGS